MNVRLVVALIHVVAVTVHSFINREGRTGIMGAFVVWLVVILVLLLLIALFFCYRWKHSKNELMYSKWIDERVVAGISYYRSDTAPVQCDYGSFDQGVFSQQRGGEDGVFSLFLGGNAVLCPISQALECVPAE